MRVGQLIGPELQALLEETPQDVREVLDDIHPEDLADVVGALDESQAGRLLEQLPTDYAAQVFERLDEDRQEQLVQTLGVDRAAELAREMAPDDRADFFSVIPSSLGDPILQRLRTEAPSVVEELRELRQWSETSAGGLMTTDYIDIAPKLSIRDAIAEVRRHADDAETIDTLFVTSAKDSLLGILTIKRMLLAEPSELVSSVMLENFKSVPPEMDQEEVARVLAKYDLNTLPVVDERGELLGVITADDILDVLTEEQSEDVHKMGAMEPLRDGYFETSYGLFLKKRAPWLLILFIGGFATTQTMQGFETELATITQLAFYLPLLIAAGGNSGSQSSTLIIRALAVGELRSNDWYRVLFRETLQGLTLGLLLAVLGFGRALLAGDGLQFALLVATTIICIVVVGCVIGAMTPLLMHRLGVDPATSSTPFIATLVDVAGIFVYLSLARLLLGRLAVASVAG